MPIEKRPATPLPKGPRPGSRPQPHKVTDDETLESVARKYHVPVKQLLLHNFGTMDPAEINWYLREQVGCNLPTHDQRNWRFSSTARPGLIYIPQRPLMQMDALEIVGSAPKPLDLNLPGPPEFLASEKFTHEFKIPPKEPADLGYFIAQAKINIEGELKQQAGWLKLSLKKGQVKAALEKKLSEDTKASFAVKFDEKSLQPVADAVLKQNKDGLLKALLAPFEASIKTTYRWGKLSIVPEAGLEISKTPLIIRVSGEFEDYLVFEGSPYKGKFVVKAGFNVGLSKKGWAWVADRVGKPVLQRFLTTGSRILTPIAEWLTAEGVLATAGIAAATLAGTVAFTTLMAVLVEDTKRKGELKGLATWYVQAYTARIFRESRPSGFIAGDTQLRDRLVQAGEKDAVLDARAILANASPTAANGSDQQVLEQVREILLAESNGSEYNAKLKLRQMLEEKSQRLAGL